MSIVRKIYDEAAEEEREILRIIDIVTGPIIFNHYGEYVQELRNTGEVSINGIVSSEGEAFLFEEAFEVLLHRGYGDK